MNLTSQKIQNQKSELAYLNVFTTAQSLSDLSKRIRVNEIRKKPAAKRIQFKLKGISFDMIRCPAGSFIMGSDDQENIPDNPLKYEKISQAFMLGETEVTRELYMEVMRSTSTKKIDISPDVAKKPQGNVTWYDAVMFCNNLSLIQNKKPYYTITSIVSDSYGSNSIESAVVRINPNSNGFRLPTEKEWEYAAKAGTDNRWSGCDDANILINYAWFKQDRGDMIYEVKTKESNEWGFHDMSGNVWEWCWDAYEKNPKAHICKGGCVSNEPIDLQNAGNIPSLAIAKNNLIGFRIALSLKE